jgi:hypothetical protein
MPSATMNRILNLLPTRQKCRNFVECHNLGKVSARTRHGILWLCGGCYGLLKTNTQAFFDKIMWWKK